MIFACLLCFALGCSEISELAGLQDDTSNDCVYTLRTSADSHRVSLNGTNRRLPLEQPHFVQARGAPRGEDLPARIRRSRLITNRS